MATLDLDPASGAFDPTELQRLLDGRYAELRARIREVMSRPEFEPPVEISREDYRATVMGRALRLADEGMTAPGFPERYGGEGDNVVLMLLMARGLLTGYAEQFTGLSPVGMASFVATQAAELVVERLFARKIAQVVGDWVGSTGDEEDLLDPAVQLALFEWREGHITASAAQRFRRHIKDGHAPFEVFRSIEDHVVDVARAHMATVLVRAFQRAVGDCPDGPARAALKQLCDLFALTEIEREKGFYQEHGRLSGPRCKRVSRQVGELCDRVRAHAGAYVDAFGIPDAVLRVPIGLAEDR
jgi:acyl-CoA oxidase